ncbi:MAG: PAS domain S-box protein [Prolixibacteraceae bacterium]|nr:PAS domain S-box protein [Prolixibacteraceae bacterium]
MQNDINYNAELETVKNRLVNTSLLTAVIAGFPLLLLSIYRGITYECHSMPIAYSVVYIVLIVVAILRKKINYNVRASLIVVLIILLGLIDLNKIGFLSMAVLWLSLSVIMTFLYFNMRKSLYVLVLSVFLLILVKLLQQIGFNPQVVDLVVYNETYLLPIIRILGLLLVSSFVVFSMKQLTQKFLNNIEDLANERNNLIKVADRLQKEIIENKRLKRQTIVNERNFRNIFENNADPMVVFSKQGEIIDYNSCFVSSMGLTLEELHNANILELIPDNYVEKFDIYRSNLQKLPSRFDLNYFSNRMGRNRYLDVTTAIVNFNGEDSILAIFRDNTEKNDREKLVYSAALRAEEKERLRLSRELHDGLGPLLSTLKIYFEAMGKHPNNDEIKKRIGNTIEESIRSVREISNNLSPYVLQNLGVVKALNAFVDKIVFTNKISIKLDSNFDKRFDEDIEITVYRLVTELINNTLKHAQAKNIEVIMHLNNLKLNIAYRDNGIGFDISSHKIDEGIGLFNMKSRIEKMGGTFMIDSVPGKGFIMNATIEIQQA